MNILRLPTVKAKLGHRSDASVYNSIRAGTFTAGVAIGQRARGWPEHEVDAINLAKVAGKSDDDIRILVKLLYDQRASYGVDVCNPQPQKVESVTKTGVGNV